VKAGVRARKRPVVVDAMQWTGKNTGPLKAWMMGFVVEAIDGAPRHERRAVKQAVRDFEVAMFVKRRSTGMTEALFRNLIDDPSPECSAALWVAANESYLPLVDGEWVIHDSVGFYPCQEAVFAATYDVLPDG